MPENNAITEVAFIPGKFQGPVIHRDFAFHKGYLYAVCDQGNSSLQVIDVQNLPSEYLVVLDDSTHVIRAHNVTVDEFGEKLYVSGVDGSPMKVFDISKSPENPELVTDLLGDPLIEYVHDVYARRDSVFMNCGNQGLYIYDYSNPSSPQILGALTDYIGQGYNHSGWVTEDANYYVFTDETEGHRMKIVDISDFLDLEIISVFNSELNLGGEYVSNTAAHNVEWIGDKIYVSHYFDGLQIFDVSDPYSPKAFGYFDTYVEDNTLWRGAWGIHVMPSGRILISDRQSGLYVFKEIDPSSEFFNDIWIYPNPSQGLFTVNLTQFEFDELRLEIYDSQGKEILNQTMDNSLLDTRYIQPDIPALQRGNYIVKVFLDNEFLDFGRISVE